MIRGAIIGAVMGMALALPVAAQDQAQTLADIRAELQVLAGSLQGLRAELVAGGQPALQAAGGAGALDRMNALEAALTRLTARTEEIGNRIDRVVQDGTNRVGDLEFRLCELEEGCDPATLPVTESIGGPVTAAAGTGAVTAPATGGAATAGPELALNEQADFDRAKAALDAGDFQGAADQFSAFAQNYPGGPLTTEASFLRGEALGRLNQTAPAARAYLDAFSAQPDGPRAPTALLRLGASLGLLGQTQEACVTLREVPVRFPAAPEAAEAQVAMQSLACQ
jgi:tol-pal system protein YbgF